MENKIIFKASVGSVNYNLQTKGSDRDYKVFVYPTFKDLFEEKRTSISKKIEGEDVNIVDIRNFPSLMFKSNVNFIEVLFAQEVDIRDSQFMEILTKKEEIARINLPYLFKACSGMAITRLKMAQNPTERSMESFEKYGYDIKSAYQSIRIMDFVVRYANTDFQDFAKSIYYDDVDVSRELIMDIRTGQLTKEEFLTVYRDKEVELLKLKELYLNQTENHELMKYLNNFIECRVRDSIKTELF